MLRRFRSLALPLVACLPLAACGDDSSASPATPLETSLSDDTQVGSLDESGKAAFCQEVSAWYSTQVSPASGQKLACYSFALAFTGGESSTCNQFARECMAEDGSGFSASPAVECETERLEGCTATVAELERCFTATATKVRELVSTISCGMSLTRLANLGDPPSECAPVEAKCPALFEDDEEL